MARVSHWAGVFSPLLSEDKTAAPISRTALAKLLTAAGPVTFRARLEFRTEESSPDEVNRLFPI